MEKQNGNLKLHHWRH